jgi:hypothetical protein
VKDGDEIVGETIDPRGRRVVLLSRIWHGKVVIEHPEMLLFASAALKAITTAQHVEVDPSYAKRMHYFVRGVGPSNWLLVVVSYEQVPARIITAYARRKDPLKWDP